MINILNLQHFVSCIIIVVGHTRHPSFSLINFRYNIHPSPTLRFRVNNVRIITWICLNVLDFELFIMTHFSPHFIENHPKLDVGRGIWYQHVYQSRVDFLIK